jgi:hypothetical protein
VAQVERIGVDFAVRLVGGRFMEAVRDDGGLPDRARAAAWRGNKSSPAEICLVHANAGFVLQRRVMARPMRAPPVRLDRLTNLAGSKRLPPRASPSRRRLIGIVHCSTTRG